VETEERFIAATHELRTGPRLAWTRHDFGGRRRPDYTARVAGGRLHVGDGRCESGMVTFETDAGKIFTVATATSVPESVAMDWAEGIPSLLVEDAEAEDALIWLAEAIAPHLAPAPRFNASETGSVPLGFRAFCREPSSYVFVPPWKWDPMTPVHCLCFPQRHRIIPSSRGTCGYHGALSPFAVIPYMRVGLAPQMLVCAPFGRVLLHEDVWRAERYDVLAIVVPLEANVPPDPRVIRARNLPLRAWDVARELLAFAGLDTVPVA
jgi:hypothetical protein